MLPKKGLDYEYVRERMRREHAAKYKPAVRKSMFNQVKIAEGETAARELEAEFNDKSSLTGAGNKQCGFGEGKRGSSGHYVWEDSQGWVLS